MAALYFFKGVIITVIKFVVGSDYSLSEYRINTFLLNRVAGLLLLPFSIAAAYLDIDSVRIVLIGALIVMLLFVAFRLVRGIAGALENGVSPAYIFLYICTLEILPFAVMAKLLVHA